MDRGVCSQVVERSEVRVRVSSSKGPTFKDDTKRALSDLLAHTVVGTDDIVGRARRVRMRHGGCRGKERKEGRERERNKARAKWKKPKGKQGTQPRSGSGSLLQLATLNSGVSSALPPNSHIYERNLEFMTIICTIQTILQKKLK